MLKRTALPVNLIGLRRIDQPLLALAVAEQWRNALQVLLPLLAFTQRKSMVWGAWLVRILEMKKKVVRIVTALTLLCTLPAVADFSITVNFDPGVDEGYKSAFNNAASFWEAQITGYRHNDVVLQGITIGANVATNDGVGGVLGFAGPSRGWFFDDIVLAGDAAASDVLYTSGGSMTFDSDDVDNLIAANSWETVIQHEMAHVIGFGILWGYDTGTVIYNDFYTVGSGQYTGAAGLAAYQAEFDAVATYVPVELGGGGGTVNGHWNEVDGGAGLTGIVDGEGNDLRDELMTGWLNTPSFLSDTTLGQFYDMGYTVIPEPSSIVMVVFFGGLGLWIRRTFLI